ncbi:TnpV protein [Flintibacter sp. P01028]
MQESITKKLKAEDQMEWMRKMNSIYICTKEIFYDELIYR